MIHAKPNLQLFVTRRCQLRCVYCPVVKGEAAMTLETALAGAEFLLGHRGGAVRLDFGGGEPLLNFDVVRETAGYAARRARDLGKRLSFYLVTNAVALGEGVLDWLRRLDIRLELSLDGDEATHNRFKRASEPGLDPYAATRRGVERAVRSGVPHYVIAVASPANVRGLAKNFEHLLDLGVRHVDVAYALGSRWLEDDQRAFFEQMDRILDRHKRPLRGGELELANLRERVEPAILNSELMVDVDGSRHLLSEWMFETTPAGAPPPFPLGRLGDGRDINDIRWDSFTCYYTLVRMYGHDPRVRSVVLNNIGFGTRVGLYFADRAAP